MAQNNFDRRAAIWQVTQSDISVTNAIITHYSYNWFLIINCRSNDDSLVIFQDENKMQKRNQLGGNVETHCCYLSSLQQEFVFSETTKQAKSQVSWPSTWWWRERGLLSVDVVVINFANSWHNQNIDALFIASRSKQHWQRYYSSCLRWQILIHYIST